MQWANDLLNNVNNLVQQWNSKVILQLQAAQLERTYKKFEELGGSSEEKPTDPELKELLEHLKYVFLS